MPVIKAKVTPLPKDDKTDRSWYNVEISTYKETIKGKFEHWELRYLIQQIDNAIY